jgi:hypothetical protein
LYVDGILVDSKNDATTGSLQNNYDISIGNGGVTYDSYDFNGQIDDVKIYNYTRTQGQIVEDMNAGHPIPGSPIGSATAHYKFDEGYGTTANNSGNSGSALNGSITSATWNNNGKFGKALNFTNGSNTWVIIPSDTSLRYGSGGMTLSAWIKTSATGIIQNIIRKDNGSGLNGYIFRIESDNRLRISFLDGTGGPSTYTTAGLVTDGAWHHVVAILNRTLGYQYLYVDGKQVNSGATSVGDDNVSYTVAIGGTNASEALTGLIDEVKFYNFALTADQVKVEYNQGQAVVFGANTSTSGTADWSSQRDYCPPGDTVTCNPPVAHWKLDENTGTTIYDSSANGNTSTTWEGDTKWTTGIFGSGLSFDGDSDVVRFAESTSTDLGSTTDSYTVEAWFKTASNCGVYCSIVVKSGNSTGAFPFNFHLAGDNKLNFRISDGGDRSAISPLTYNDNNWHYATGVRNVTTDTLYLYVDGILVDSTNDATTGSLQNNYDISIGNGGVAYDSFDFNGQIDDVKIYNYARTPAQIAWDYNQGAPLVWYKFDECSGSTANNAAPAASGGDSGNDATIYPVTNGNTSTGSCNSGVNTEMWNNGTTGKINASLDFDGNDDYAATGNTALIASNSLTYSKVSWGGWFKPATDTDGDTLIHKGSEFRLTSASSTGLPQCEIYYSSAWHVIATGKSRPTTTSWTHLLCTYDGTNGKLYVNGMLNDYKADANSITSSSATRLSIARDSGGSGYFDGLVDSAKVWGYALSSEQVKTEFNGGSAVKF